MDNHAGNFNIEELRWLGGLIDSDGCVCISSSKRRNNKIVYTPSVVITNMNSIIVETVHNIFSNLNINHHIKPNGSCKNIVVSRPNIIIKLCALLNDYVIVKGNELDIINSFCGSRVSRVTELGCNWKACYTEYEIALVNELTILNGNHYKECIEYGISENLINDSNLNKFSLSWLAGFIDGDGCFTINKTRRPNGNFQYQPMIHIVTGSPLAKNIIAIYLDRYNIDYYLKKELPGKKHKANCKNKKFEFYVRSLNDCRVLSSLLLDKLHGKNERCGKLIGFCDSRISNKNKPYSDYEINLHDYIKNDIKDSSTTKSKTSNDEDIV